MLSYELAKQLKDAGFRQAGNGQWFNEHDSPAGGAFFELEDVQQHFKVFDEVYASYYVPTLSELIAACGDKLDALENLGGGHFLAGARWDTWMADYTLKGTGTPEEAVAQLWLALNKK